MDPRAPLKTDPPATTDHKRIGMVDCPTGPAPAPSGETSAGTAIRLRHFGLVPNGSCMWGFEIALVDHARKLG